MSVMCTFGYKECVEKSKKLYEDWLADPNKRIPGNFKQIVMSAVIRFGDESDWNKMFSLATSTQDSSDRVAFMRALAASRDFNLLEL